MGIDRANPELDRRWQLRGGKGCRVAKADHADCQFEDLESNPFSESPRGGGILCGRRAGSPHRTTRRERHRPTRGPRHDVGDLGAPRAPSERAGDRPTGRVPRREIDRVQPRVRVIHHPRDEEKDARDARDAPAVRAPSRRLHRRFQARSRRRPRWGRVRARRRHPTRVRRQDDRRTRPDVPREGPQRHGRQIRAHRPTHARQGRKRDVHPVQRRTHRRARRGRRWRRHPRAPRPRRSRRPRRPRRARGGSNPIRVDPTGALLRARESAEAARRRRTRRGRGEARGVRGGECEPHRRREGQGGGGATS